MEYYSKIKGNRDLIPTAPQMSLEDSMVSKRCQMQKETLYDATYIKLKNKQIYRGSKLCMSRGWEERIRIY
jgi:hypothetical protein